MKKFRIVRALVEYDNELDPKDFFEPGNRINSDCGNKFSRGIYVAELEEDTLENSIEHLEQGKNILDNLKFGFEESKEWDLSEIMDTFIESTQNIIDKISDYKN